MTFRALKKTIVKPNEIEFNNSRFKNSRNITLPIFAYRNLKVYNKNDQELLYKVNSYRQIVVRKTNNSNLIKVKYQMSNLDKFSVVTSMLTWIIGVISFVRNKKWLGSLKKTKF